MAFKSRNLFDPEKQFKISRSGVEQFLNCPRCFYLDKKIGLKQPQGFPFNLNSAVDELLKNEFDEYRKIQKPHPYMKGLNKNIVPFEHEDLDKWRQNFVGVQYEDNELNIKFTGAVDDVWIDLDTEEIIVVDYKSTSKKDEVTIDADWQISYRRQMDFYQWLLRKNNFKVSDIGYFVYCNGIKEKKNFDNILEFKVSVLPYTGNTDWIETTLQEIKKTLLEDNLPDEDLSCDLCDYFVSREGI